MRIITDAEIQELLKERKVLPAKFKLKKKKKQKINHDEFEAIVKGIRHKFTIIARKSRINPLDFSIILRTYIDNRDFTLKRYNGSGQPVHYNKIERTRITGCHIHVATQRYQERGFKEETYADASSLYKDCAGAYKLLKTENGFEEKGIRRLDTFIR